MAESRKWGGLVGGTGGAAVSVMQATHPEWFGNHPWITPVSLGCFALSVFLYLAQHRWFQKALLGVPDKQDTQPASIPTAVATANPIVSPTITASPVISPSFAQHIHIPQAPTNVKDAVPPPTAPVYPELHLEPGFPRIRYDERLGLWENVPLDEPPTGPTCIGVWVTNPKAEEGSIQPSTGKIKAHLEFFFGKFLLPISVGDRAYWAGRAESFTMLDAAETRAVLLGVLEEKMVKVYTNPHSADRPKGRTPRAYENWYRELGAPIQLHYFPLDCTVSIISVDTGHTLISRRFRITNNPPGTGAFGIQDITGMEHLLKP